LSIFLSLDEKEMNPETVSDKKQANFVPNLKTLFTNKIIPKQKLQNE